MASPVDRQPVEFTEEEAEVTFWILVASSWMPGYGNWGTRYEQID